MGVVFQNCVRLPTAGRLCARDREMEGGGVYIHSAVIL